MSARRKPQGAEYEKFKRDWEASDHEHKIRMCADFGVTYDTAKHWYSEGDTIKKEPEAETIAQVCSSQIEDVAHAIGQVLSTHPVTKLDIVSFDIETTNLTADFSIMLCACIKPWGEDAMIWRGDSYPGWKDNRADDSFIVKAVSDELGQHSVVITHYGTGFDIPYLRAKMIRYGLPPLPPMFSVDTYGIAKANLRVASKRLEALCAYFDLGKKEKVAGNLWLQAGLNGSQESMDKIVEHCILDVELLERLASILFPYVRSMRKI